MDLIKGNKLRCKKSLKFEDEDYYICIKDDIFTIEHLAQFYITLINPNPSIPNISFKLNEEKYLEYRYIWDYFETKIDRTKRIIDEFKKR